MNDFNLRPEIMGFGRPERVLAAEAAPPKLLPADQWKPHGADFEVNGLGQLRTALALPAPEAEIAASMRHADAAPIARRPFEGCRRDGCNLSRGAGRFSSTEKIMAQKSQTENYTARYMAMSDAEMVAIRRVPQECDEDGEAFRRELRIRGL